MRVLFCPNCHQRIIPPSFMENVKIEGKIKLSCGNCNKDGNGNPKGVLIIHPNNQESNKQSTVQ